MTKQTDIHQQLYYNAGCGELAKVKELHEQGADINFKSRSHDTPLMNAAKQGRLNVVEYLLEKGANPNHKDENGKTAFLLAAEYLSSTFESNIHYWRLIQGSKNTQENKTELNEAFVAAATNRNLSVCRDLLALGADINARNQKGYSALGEAIKLTEIGWKSDCIKAFKLAEFLIQNKADVDCKTGQPPLIFAARLGNIAAVKLLLDNGANPNIQNRYGTTPLIAISRRYHTMLMTTDRREYQSKDGKNPLDEVITLLLQHNADITLKNSKGKTFAQISKKELNKRNFLNALVNRNYEEMEKLIKAGRSVNIQMRTFLPFLGDLDWETYYYWPSKNTTLLSFAINENDATLVEFLLKMGADPNQKANRSNSEKAKMWGNAKIIELISQAKASDILQSQRHDSTPPLNDESIKSKQKINRLFRPDKGIYIGHKRADSLIKEKRPRLLINALIKRDYKQMENLIIAGYPVNARLRKGSNWNHSMSNVFFPDKNDTAFSYAVNENDETLVAFLLKKGANPNSRTGASNLKQAMINNNPIIVELLLKANARYFEKGRYHYAVGVSDNEEQLAAWKKHGQYRHYMTTEESLLQQQKIDELLRVYQVKRPETDTSLIAKNLSAVAITPPAEIPNQIPTQPIRRTTENLSPSFNAALSFWVTQEKIGKKEQEAAEEFRARYGH